VQPKFSMHSVFIFVKCTKSAQASFNLCLVKKRTPQLRTFLTSSGKMYSPAKVSLSFRLVEWTSFGHFEKMYDPWSVFVL
jgi:hypothetical protein